LGALPQKKFGAKKVQNLAQLQTTLDFHGEYLRNRSRYQKSENLLIYCSPSHVRRKKLANVGPLTEKFLTCILTDLCDVQGLQMPQSQAAVSSSSAPPLPTTSAASQPVNVQPPAPPQPPPATVSSDWSSTAPMPGSAQPAFDKVPKSATVALSCQFTHTHTHTSFVSITPFISIVYVCYMLIAIT